MQFASLVYSDKLNLAPRFHELYVNFMQIMQISLSYVSIVYELEFRFVNSVFARSVESARTLLSQSPYYRYKGDKARGEPSMH